MVIEHEERMLNKLVVALIALSAIVLASPQSELPADDDEANTQPAPNPAPVAPIPADRPMYRDPYNRPVARDPYYARMPYSRDQYARDPYARDPYARDPYARDPYQQRSVYNGPNDLSTFRRRPFNPRVFQMANQKGNGRVVQVGNNNDPNSDTLQIGSAGDGPGISPEQADFLKFIMSS